MQGKIEAAKFRHILTNKNFMFLWLSQFFCQLADRMFSYTLIVSAYHLGQNSNLGASLPMVAFGIPAILFSIPFGVLVDRFRKHSILFYSNFWRMLLILAVPFTPWIDKSLLGLFVLSFIVFTISQLFIPAELASITYLVNKRELVLANSMFLITWMFSSIISFATATPIAYHYGADSVYFVASGLYLLATLLIVLVKIPEKTHQIQRKASSLWRELRLGLRFVLKHRIVFYAMSDLGFSISLLAILSTVAIGFVDTKLKLPSSDFGYLVAIAGLGMVFGISLLSHLIRSLKNIHIIFIGINLAGIALIALSNITNVLNAFLIVFLLGLANSFITAPLQAIVQERTPENIRGKVFSIQNLVSSFAYTLPPIIAGYCADHYGHTIVFLTLGIGTLLLNFSLKKLHN